MRHLREADATAGIDGGRKLLLVEVRVDCILGGQGTMTDLENVRAVLKEIRRRLNRQEHVNAHPLVAALEAAIDEPKHCCAEKTWAVVAKALAPLIREEK